MFHLSPSPTPQTPSALPTEPLLSASAALTDLQPQSPESCKFSTFDSSNLPPSPNDKSEEPAYRIASYPSSDCLQHAEVGQDFMVMPKSIFGIFMNELFNNSATADIIFRIQSPSSSSHYEYLYAQRSILTARSSYFAETLNTKQKKKTKKGKGQVVETKSTVDGAKEISVQRIRYRTFYSFVRWLYSGSIHFATPYFTGPYDHYEGQLVELDRENGATHCNPLEVYVCADRYGSDDLKRLVLNSLPQCLGGGLAFSLLFTPHALAYEDIKQCLLGYIKEHIAELKLSKDLVDLVLNRPTGLDMELDATMVGLRFRDDRAAQAWKDVLEILIGA